MASQIARAIFIVFLGVVILSLAIWGTVILTIKSEPEPTSPSIVTFSHPTGSITCVYTDAAIDCMPTWLQIPTWVPFEEAKALYSGATNGQ